MVSTHTSTHHQSMLAPRFSTSPVQKMIATLLTGTKLPIVLILCVNKSHCLVNTHFFAPLKIFELFESSKMILYCGTRSWLSGWHLLTAVTHFSPFESTFTVETHYAIGYFTQQLGPDKPIIIVTDKSIPSFFHLSITYSWESLK